MVLQLHQGSQLLCASSRHHHLRARFQETVRSPQHEQPLQLVELALRASWRVERQLWKHSSAIHHAKNAGKPSRQPHRLVSDGDRVSTNDVQELDENSEVEMGKVEVEHEAIVQPRLQSSELLDLQAKSRDTTILRARRRWTHDQ